MTLPLGQSGLEIETFTLTGAHLPRLYVALVPGGDQPHDRRASSFKVS